MKKYKCYFQSFIAFILIITFCSSCLTMVMTVSTSKSEGAFGGWLGDAVIAAGISSNSANATAAAVYFVGATALFIIVILASGFSRMYSGNDTDSNSHSAAGLRPIDFRSFLDGPNLFLDKHTVTMSGVK